MGPLRAQGACLALLLVLSLHGQTTSGLGFGGSPPPPGAAERSPPPPGAAERSPPPTAAAKRLPPPAAAKRSPPSPAAAKRSPPPPAKIVEPPINTLVTGCLEGIDWSVYYKGWVILGRPASTIRIGTYDPAASNATLHVYTNGTGCAGSYGRNFKWTGTVTYRCKPSARKDLLVSATEPTLCAYRLVVDTPRVCSVTAAPPSPPAPPPRPPAPPPRPPAPPMVELPINTLVTGCLEGFDWSVYYKGRVIMGQAPYTILIGTYDPAASNATLHVYTDGTDCTDIDGRNFRWTGTVTYRCKPFARKDLLVSAIEISACVHRIIVDTPRVCSVTAAPPSPQPPPPPPPPRPPAPPMVEPPINTLVTGRLLGIDWSVYYKGRVILGTPPSSTILLGTYDPAASNTTLHVYTANIDCTDSVGRNFNRAATVTYRCKPSAYKDTLVSVTQQFVCVYRLIVDTPRLCPVPPAPPSPPAPPPRPPAPPMVEPLIYTLAFANIRSVDWSLYYKSIIMQGDSILVGTYDPAASNTTHHVYANGKSCTGNDGQPFKRTGTVTYRCRRSVPKDTLVSATEPSPCVFRLVVDSPRLCPWYAWPPPSPPAPSPPPRPPPSPPALGSWSKPIDIPSLPFLSKTYKAKDYSKVLFPTPFCDREAFPIRDGQDQREEMLVFRWHAGTKSMARTVLAVFTYFKSDHKAVSVLSSPRKEGGNFTCVGATKEYALPGSYFTKVFFTARFGLYYFITSHDRMNNDYGSPAFSLEVSLPPRLRLPPPPAKGLSYVLFNDVPSYFWYFNRVPAEIGWLPGLDFSCRPGNESRQGCFSAAVKKRFAVQATGLLRVTTPVSKQKVQFVVTTSGQARVLIAGKEVLYHEEIVWKLVTLTSVKMSLPAGDVAIVVQFVHILGFLNSTLKLSWKIGTADETPLPLFPSKARG